MILAALRPTPVPSTTTTSSSISPRMAEVR
nr:MAG TPA: hypothetical protein [Caudoviricetes sp.]